MRELLIIKGKLFIKFGKFIMPILDHSSFKIDMQDNVAVVEFENGDEFTFNNFTFDDERHGCIRVKNNIEVK